MNRFFFFSLEYIHFTISITALSAERLNNFDYMVVMSPNIVAEKEICPPVDHIRENSHNLHHRYYFQPCHCTEIKFSRGASEVLSDKT